MSCGVGCRCVSELAWLWLERRLAAIAWIRPIAWEPPYATGEALKKQKKNIDKVHTASKQFSKNKRLNI